MPGQVRWWMAVSILLGAGLLASSLVLRDSGRVPDYESAAISIAILESIALILGSILIAFLAGRFFRDDGAEGPARTHDRPYLTLFVISFVALFVELMLIRYCSAQIRVFSFYKNVPLIASFLGLGLGASLSRGRPRDGLLFLLWLVPFAVFLSGGSLVMGNFLGRHAALGSSEQILGEVIPPTGEPGGRLVSQILMASFCVVTLGVITLLFTFLGKLLGTAFDRVGRLRGYTINISGSLAGILAFVLFSYLQTPPALWFLVGLVPLLWWAPRRSWAAVAIVLSLVNAAAVFPSYGETVWSRYQKLVGHPIGLPGEPPQAYLVQISDVFYQIALDRSPEKVAGQSNYPGASYDLVYRDIPTPDRVLIVGAGTGNDVAAALRAGVRQIDAVDIDNAIVEMGRRSHPERPYQDPRVRVIVDDARHAFRELPAQSYDAVVFGLLDSHTQLGMSSVRLDNFVFTQESFAEAVRLIRPGGHLIVTAAAHFPWFRDRLQTMVEVATGNTPRVSTQATWFIFIGRVDANAGRSGSTARAGLLPSDDWPFLYLPAQTIPRAYLWVVLALALASVVILRVRGLSWQRFDSELGHLFFLGAAFLLMEVHAINRLALVFGTTWLVSAITIAIVLTLIMLANLAVARIPRIPYGVAYGALALSLGVSYVIEPGSMPGGGPAAGWLFGLILLSPVFFAGLIFARSFRITRTAGPAIGANILGSVVGGWAEYSTMAFGMRALVLLAAGFYLLSAVLLVRSLRRRSP